MKRSPLRRTDGLSRLTVPLRKCKACGAAFTPARKMQRACSVACAMGHAFADPKRAERAFAKRQKVERAETKAKLIALKPRSKWLKEAQAAVNRYCRLRDISRGYGCITCGAAFGSKYGGGFDAGHMISRGSAPHLRFRLDNIALQCVKDNRYLGGLAPQFRAAMVARRGIETVESLEASQGPAKFTVDYLQRLKRIFAKKAKRLERHLELQD